MATQQIKNPLPTFTDIDGTPLENGHIYIGTSGLNPITNPLQAYWDEALTIPASNIRTKEGYASNNGNPGRLFISTDFLDLLNISKDFLLPLPNILSTFAVALFDSLCFNIMFILSV